VSGLAQNARLQGLKPCFVRRLTAGLKPRPSEYGLPKFRGPKFLLSEVCFSSSACADTALRCATFSNQGFVRWLFFVAVRKSFLVWFHGFMNFLNSGLLRLGFWGRVCCDLVSAKLDRVLRRCDGSSRTLAERGLRVDWAVHRATRGR